MAKAPADSTSMMPMAQTNDTIVALPEETSQIHEPKQEKKLAQGQEPEQGQGQGEGEEQEREQKSKRPRSKSNALVLGQRKCHRLMLCLI